MDAAASLPTADLPGLRRALHRRPEVSGSERETARAVLGHLRSLGPDRVWTGLGGHGVAAAFDGRAAAPDSGPTCLVRAELDALPIDDHIASDHRSETPGVGHKCGHDGHMTILLGLVARIASSRPAAGRFVALFQPAEETGEGARAVAADPRFDELRPDWAFALHNLPGAPLGAVVVRTGTFNCASRGRVCRLTGATSHAAHPEEGRSPAAALCELVQELGALHERPEIEGGGLALSTVVHARLGEVAFGTAPGEAVVMATLRAERDGTMERLASLALDRVAAVANAHGVDAEVTWRDVFDASVNDAEATDRVRVAARTSGAPLVERGAAFRWSEDFGALGRTARSAMFGLGAGEGHPGLHAPDYDFPDALIVPGVDLFERVVRDLLDAPQAP
ncbi:MAG: amidohydrolase [Planctomycetota bacterium]